MIRPQNIPRLILWGIAALFAQPSRAETDETGFAKITHIDVSEAYLRFDRALMARPPDDSRTAEFAAEWDRTSQLLYWGIYPEAIQRYDMLALKAAGIDPVPIDLQAAASLKIRVEPPISLVGGDPAPEATFVSYYPIPGLKPAEVSLTLRVRDASGKAVIEKPIRLEAAPKGQVDMRAPLCDPKSIPPVGTYQVEIEAGAFPPLRPCKWTVAARSHDALREALRARLQAAKGEEAALAHAIDLAKSRLQLLGDRPSEFRDAQYLADPLKLAEEIEGEVAAIERGENPYKNKAGDYWRVVRDEQKQGSAMRLLAPRAVADGKPLPLVIALPGTGGDENSFFDGFGQGLLPKLGEERGFLALSCARETFDLKRTLDSIRIDYNVDPERIYALGHSLGAEAAAIISRERPDIIAAAVCMNGGSGFFVYPKAPPALCITADNDNINPHERIEAQARKGKGAGADVELRIAKGTAHSFTVARELPAAIDWLLARKLQPPAKKP